MAKVPIWNINPFLSNPRKSNLEPEPILSKFHSSENPGYFEKLKRRSMQNQQFFTLSQCSHFLPPPFSFHTQFFIPSASFPNYPIPRTTLQSPLQYFISHVQKLQYVPHPTPFMNLLLKPRHHRNMIHNSNISNITFLTATVTSYWDQLSSI